MLICIVPKNSVYIPLVVKAIFSRWLAAVEPWWSFPLPVLAFLVGLLANFDDGYL